jgi:hypothetical protein
VVRFMSLHKDPRTGIFQYHKVVPEALRPFFGKREFKVSLGTRDPAEARSKMHAPAAEYERLADDARRAVGQGWSPIAQAMVTRWLLDTGRDDRWLLRAGARLVAYCQVSERFGASLPPPGFAFSLPSSRRMETNSPARARWPRSGRCSGLNGSRFFCRFPLRAFSGP